MPRRDTNIGGIIAAVPTVVDDNNLPKMVDFIAHCKWAMDNGCDGLNILGTTGEANSQGLPTRKAIMKAAAENIDGSKLMVGTGTSDLETTIALTKYADELGYAVALVLPPFYYKPAFDDGIFAYFKTLDKTLEGLNIVVYLYNFPALSGVKFSVELIKRMATEMPERIRGIKDSSGDIPYCQEIVAAVPGFKVFPSNEVCVGDARANGFAGCISGSVNVTSPWAAQLWRSSDSDNSNDLAQLLSELRTSISSVPLVQAVKHLIGQREKEPNWDNVIPPLVALTESEKNLLRPVAQKLGYI